MRRFNGAMLLVVLFAVSLGGCGDDDAKDPPRDGGAQDGNASDGNTLDGNPSDGTVPDGGPSDGGDSDGDVPDGSPLDGGFDGSPRDGSTDSSPDAPVTQCGDGNIDPGEDCDMSALGGATCVSLGQPDGVLGCKADCSFDTLGCAVCDDGICGPGESATACPADCAVVDVAAGDTHTCAALANGSVRCWGARDGHRMGGAPDLREPVEVPGITGATAVAAGSSHSCAIVAGGEVYCWGRNGYGEVGIGSTSREVFPPQKVVSLPAATKVVLGRNHSCAITTSGETWCWGRSDGGQVGSGFHHRQPTPSRVGQLVNTQGLAAGDYHTCAVAGTGLYCWGRNDRGQVGVGDNLWRSTPGSTVGKAIAVGAGARHTCITRYDLAAPPLLSGTFCFGSNSYGQLGSAPTPDVMAPQRVSSFEADVLVAGRAFTCAFHFVNGVPLCWGRNDFGQLGDGTQNLRYVPAAVTGVADAVNLTAGAEHACALMGDGTLRCWGRNHVGQLGDGSQEAFRTTAVEPVGL